VEQQPGCQIKNNKALPSRFLYLTRLVTVASFGAAGCFTANLQELQHTSTQQVSEANSGQAFGFTVMLHGLIPAPVGQHNLTVILYLPGWLQGV
jgi:hypothetical protein